MTIIDWTQFVKTSLDIVLAVLPLLLTQAAR